MADTSLQRLLGPIEAAGTLGSGIASGSIGGLAGLIRAISAKSPEEAMQRIADTSAAVSEAGTYIPRTETGQTALLDLMRLGEKGGELVREYVPPLSPEWRGDKALEATGSPAAATAADLFADPLGTLGKLSPAMFLGARAMRRATAAGDMVPQEMFDIANALRSKGKSKEDIWNATAMHAARKEAPYSGAMIDQMGDPMFEISDAPARWKSPEERAALQGDVTLDQVLDHSQLYELFPELKTSPFREFDPSTSAAGGYYSPKDASINIKAGGSQPQLEDVGIHEIQHAVQDAERWKGRGGSPTEFIPEEPDLRTVRKEADISARAAGLREMADLLGRSPAMHARSLRKVSKNPMEFRDMSPGEQQRIIKEAESMAPEQLRERSQKASDVAFRLEQLAESPEARKQAYFSDPGEIAARRASRRRTLLTPELRKRDPQQYGSPFGVDTLSGPDAYQRPSQIIDALRLK